MKALFLVNGTGLGHITQTFALCDLFARHGRPLTPVAVMVTNCPPASLAVVRDFYKCPVIEAPSLRFYMNRAGEVSSWRTGLGSLLDLRDCSRSVDRLQALIEETRPDVLLNFYEVLGGFYHWRYRAAIPWVAISHQFMSFHPSYATNVHCAPWLPQWQVLRLLTRLTGIGATHRIALSFYPAEPHGNLFVTSSLLRQQVFAASPADGDYILAYLSNGSLLPKLVRYCERHPEQPVRCFCIDRPAATPPNLEMRALDRKQYLTELIGCRGLIATSGFESVSEAAVLGKPVVVLPLKNHLEQALNARDAQRNRIAIRSVAPRDEIPDIDWRPIRPITEYRDFVLNENRRLYEHLAALFPTPAAPPLTLEVPGYLPA